MSYCLNPDCLRPQNLDDHQFCQACGTKLLLRERYRAIKPIGQGGFGKTFLAVDCDKPSKPPCVIKQFSPSSQGTNNVDKAKELFNQEAERLESLGKHPQIPELLAHFEQDKQLYLIQEYIDGENLAQVLEEKGVWRETEIKSLLIGLLPVLEFIHHHNVIHRDIKPENIIQKRSDKTFVLVDFGAVKYVTGTALLKTGTMIGDPRYVAREQSRGKAVFASDLYSLGLTCLHLLTNVDPWDLSDDDEGKSIWRNFLNNNPVRDELGQVLDKMVQEFTKDRFQSAEEILSILQPLALAAQTQIPLPQASPVTPSIPIEEVDLTPIQLGNKWGYVDKMGNIVVEPQFDYIGNFSEGLAIVKKNGRDCFIDKKGAIVIELEYNQRAYSKFSDGLAVIQVDSKFGYIDKTGNMVIKPEFDSAREFSDGLAIIEVNKKCGVIDTSGNMIFQPWFDSIDGFSGRLAVFSSKKKYGVIDKTGRIILKPEFYQIRIGSFVEGVATIEINKKYGYIDEKGNIVLEPKFDWIGSFVEGLAQIQLNRKCGLVDTQGNIVLEPKFHSIGSFVEGLAQIQLNGKCGLVDTQGNIVLEPKFHSIGSFVEGLAQIQLNRKYGYIDKKGNIFIQSKFDYAGDFCEGLAIIKLNGKFGYIDKQGNIVIRPQFDRAERFQNGRAKVKKQGLFGEKEGYIDKTEKWIE